MQITIKHYDEWTAPDQFTGKERRFSRTEYRIEKGGEWCEVTLWNDSRHISGFCGSIWPPQIPELFEPFGPDAGCITHRSGYRIRDDVDMRSIASAH